MRQYFLSFIFTLGLAASICAQWVPTNGPYGGLTNCYAHSDTEIFAGTVHGGFFYSNNNGQSWEKRNNGFASLEMKTLHRQENTLYASVGVNGLYKSTDNGLNWELFTNVWFSYNVIAIESQNDHIYVGTAGGGMMVSPDNGQTWQPAVTGLIAAPSWSIGNILATDDLVFSVVNGKLYSSSDNAANWNLISGGLPSSIYSIHQSGDFLLASTLQGMYRSSNNGTSWTMANNGINMNSFFGFNCSTYENDVVIADFFNQAIYRSANNGASWIPVNYPMGNNINAVYAMGNNTLLLQTNYNDYFLNVGERAGLYLSENNGEDWTTISNNIDGTFTMHIGNHGNELYCGSRGIGLVKTNDGGEVWNPLPLFDYDVHDIYSTGTSLFVSGGGGVSRSTDNGLTWQWCNVGLNAIGVRDFAHIGNTLFCATYLGVQTSTNNGDSWITINNELSPYAVNGLLAEGNTLYAATSNGIYKSINFGISWTSISNGLPLTFGYNHLFRLNNQLYTTDQQGFYTSSDDGETWQLLSTNVLLQSVTRIIGVDNKIIASRTAPVISTSGTIVSFDGGVTWEEQGQGLTNSDIFDIEVNGNYVYAASLGSGCFKREISDFLPISVLEQNTPSFVLFPNPAQDHVTLKTPSELLGQQAILLNSMGQHVRSLGQIQQLTTSIPCSDLASGIYFLQIGKSVQRFVVN